LQYDLKKCCVYILGSISFYICNLLSLKEVVLYTVCALSLVVNDFLGCTVTNRWSGPLCGQIPLCSVMGDPMRW